MRHLALLCATPVLASAMASRTLAAQMFLGFGGLEARGGIAVAKTGGSSATFEVDLGYAFIPELRTTLGIDFFGSSFDHEISGQRVGGSMQGAGGIASFRYDVFPQRRFGIHFVAGAAVHSIRANPDDPSAKDSLGGGHAGAQFGGGLSWRIGDGQFWSATADVRRIAERDVGRTLVTVGLRYSLRGRRMYDRDDIPAVTPTPSPTALDRAAQDGQICPVPLSSVLNHSSAVEPLAHGSRSRAKPLWVRPNRECGAPRRRRQGSAHLFAGSSRS